MSIDTSSVVAGQDNQPITFSVTGGEAALAMTFFVELIDGNAPAPTLNSFSDISLDSGSIWTGKNPSQTDVAILTNAYSGSLDSDATVLNGTFGTIYVDATALSVGDTFTVSLLNVLAPENDTYFSPIGGGSQISITGETSATLTAVVPEPAFVGALAAGVGLLAARRRRA